MSTGAEHLCDELYNFGVRVVFVFTGGAISAIIDAAHRRGIKIIPYDHELDASYAAEGYVRANLRPTAVLVTSGPGATNTITGIAGSWFDSIPVLFISGQVKSFEKTNFELYLQRGFQEVDFVKSANQFTKYSNTIDHVSQTLPVLNEALDAMLIGRPGPSVLDITMDAQVESLSKSNTKKLRPISFTKLLNKGILSYKNEKPSEEDFEFLLKKMSESKNPLIVVGGGAQWMSKGVFENFVNRVGARVVSTYAGINAIQQDHPLYDGMIGPFGHIQANKNLLEASDIFILGARIPHRAFPLLSETSYKKFISIKKWVLTLDPNEFINHRIGKVEKVFRGLLYDFCKYVERKDGSDYKLKSFDNHSLVKSNLDKMFLSDSNSESDPDQNKNLYTVVNIINSLNKSLPKNSDIFVDVGQNAVALALGLHRSKGEKLFSSWANSPMGYSLPASLGAALEENGRPTICVIGDGGIRTALSSFPSLKSMKGKVKVVLWDNQGYQTIVDHMENMLSGRRNAVTVGSGLTYISIENVLSAFDLRVMKVEDELEDNMKLFFNSDKYDICIVPIDPSIRMSANPVI
jgi:acetolactate synthase I/II/III large subunit